MESVRVRWIRWAPSERLSTPSYGLMTFFYRQKLHMSDGTPTIGVLFTNGIPVFRWKANDVRWSLVDSIGQRSNELRCFYLFNFSCHEIMFVCVEGMIISQ